MSFPLRTAFVVSQKFWIVVSSFSFVSRKLWFLPWSHSWPIHCLIPWYLISMSLCVFEFLPWVWFLVSVPCGQRKCLIWFQFSWICWGLFSVLSCGLSFKMFHMHLKWMSTLPLLDARFYIYPLSPFDLGHFSVLQYF